MSEQNAETDLGAVMYSSRAMRRLQPRAVPEPMLIKLIDAANQAPSGSNAQLTRWVIVRDPEQKKKLAALNRLHGEPHIAADVAKPKEAKLKRMTMRRLSMGWTSTEKQGQSGLACKIYC